MRSTCSNAWTSYASCTDLRCRQPAAGANNTLRSSPHLRLYRANDELEPATLTLAKVIPEISVLEQTADSCVYPGQAQRHRPHASSGFVTFRSLTGAEWERSRFLLATNLKHRRSASRSRPQESCSPTTQLRRQLGPRSPGPPSPAAAARAALLPRSSRIGRRRSDGLLTRDH